MNWKNFSAKPWLLPMPVCIIGSYDEKGNPNAMNAAWAMISDTHEVTISLAHHKTTENILQTKAFTIGFATEDTIVACDYAGIVSQHKVPDKMERANFSIQKSEWVNAPILLDLKMSLECTLKSYEDEILTGEIVNVCASEDVLTNGEIDLSKLKPLLFDPIHRLYYSFGQVKGKAFSIGEALKK
ncbi:MAG: flavin reductase family protein [Floccifex sp.]